ncbi:hypothetical protein BBW65_04540 [Helicobacter enhydrae]|uniref:Triosephosphate isomerase n=1 Tax=Helicobacter enhydrae TaxID=222136 RepID=A0A1B1U5R3_9HELI|nr:triose-phosphate isomerase [Helicobacter enhydrae]ANV98113.1 hypothetical protein BBW65_04540 [Helicobacter enhydrae]
MIIAGNFKTHHTRSSTLAYAQELDSLLVGHRSEVVLFPPSSSVPYNQFEHLQIGVQNAYGVVNGAFSGEIGLEQILELQVQTLMIGHSERRKIFGESNQECFDKFRFFAQNNIKIFFCIGEDLHTRDDGKTQDMLRAQLEGIDLDYAHLVVAYEPIWAIGTGKSASVEEIWHTHSFLKNLGVRVLLYGGSVKRDNVAEILDIDGVDGVLVGGASLKIEDFYPIIQEGEKRC